MVQFTFAVLAGKYHMKNNNNNNNTYIALIRMRSKRLGLNLTLRPVYMEVGKSR